MNQYWSDAITVKSVAKNTKLIRIVRLRDIVRVLYAAGAEALYRPRHEKISTTTTMTTTLGSPRLSLTTTSAAAILR
jgi:hypothetical protein